MSYDIPYMGNLKRNETNLQNRKRLMDSKQTQRSRGGRDGYGIWEGHVRSAIFKTDN